MEPVQIGAREIYDKVVALERQVLQVQYDVSAIKEGRDRKWKLNLALFSAGVSVVLALAAPLIVR